MEPQSKNPAMQHLNGRLAFVLGLFGLLASPLAWPVTILQGPTLTMDPNGETPLAGLIEVVTDEAVQATLIVSDGSATRAVRYRGYRTDHSLYLLGLKANSSYTVNVQLTDQNGIRTDIDPLLQVVTSPLPVDFPTVEVLVSNPAKMEPGFTLLDRFSRNRAAEDPSLENYAIIFDQSGDVVWYTSLAGGTAMRQLPNGNLQFRVGNDAIERDMLGNLIGSVRLQDPGERLHHDLTLTADGNFLSLTRETIVVGGYPSS